MHTQAICMHEPQHQSYKSSKMVKIKYKNIQKFHTLQVNFIHDMYT